MKNFLIISESNQLSDCIRSLFYSVKGKKFNYYRRLPAYLFLSSNNIYSAIFISRKSIFDFLDKQEEKNLNKYNCVSIVEYITKKEVLYLKEKGVKNILVLPTTSEEVIERALSL